MLGSTFRQHVTVANFLVAYRQRAAAVQRRTIHFPTVKNANILMQSYITKGAATKHNISRICWRMYRDRVSPDRITYNIMLTAAARRNDFTDVDRLLAQMTSNKILPDAQSYNSILAHFANVGDINSCESWFDKMKEVSIDPNLVSYNTLINACAKSDIASDNTDRARFWHDTLIASSSKDVSLEPNSVTLNCMIDSLSKQDPCAAAALLNQDEVEKIRNVRSYNIVIAAFARQGDAPCCLTYFTKLRKNGLSPDSFSINSLIYAFVQRSDVVAAERWLLRAENDSLANTHTYGLVIHAFAKIGNIDSAIRVFDRMLSFKIHPDVFIFSSLITACAVIQDSHRALRCFELMSFHSIQPDLVCINAMIATFSKSGDAQGAKEFLKKVMDPANFNKGNLSNGSSTESADLQSYDAVIQSYVRDKSDANFEPYTSDLQV
jgi:pentatricopeptide repeat protein